MTFTVSIPVAISLTPVAGQENIADAPRNMALRIDVDATSHGEALEKVASRLENLMWDLTQ